MKLKKDADIMGFIKGVEACKGNVFFVSPEDKIDLKSVLSQYVFISILNDKKLMESSAIRCEATDDFKTLEPFLE